MALLKRDHQKTVAYFYDDEVGNFYYAQGHPMKPHRMRMAHHLILSYGLYKKMEMYRPSLLSYTDMTTFHASDYIHFLSHVTPDNKHEYQTELNRFNLDVDCPVFDGVFKFCQMYAGGSLGGAYKLNRGTCDIAINWSGGLHHAKKTEASGFCYVNDVVLAVLELLKYHARVLYIDIDIHHGDGVEEAFYTSNRVMTVSFHKYGDFFPGTGGIKDTGVNAGAGYALNFPMHDGMDDSSYVDMFRTIMQRVMDRFQPGAVVLQCGADSITGDRLGSFNLTLKGHGACVEFMKSFNVPLLLLGGGGYTIRNVSRCWAYETSVAVGVQLNDELPYNDFYEYYGPDFTLSIPASNMENHNTPKYLDRQRTIILQMLNDLPHVPSVAYSTVIPRDSELLTELHDNQAAAESSHRRSDIRITQAEFDAHTEADNEFYGGNNANDTGDLDDAHQTKGSHRGIKDEASLFYAASETLPSVSVNPVVAQMTAYSTDRSM